MEDISPFCGANNTPILDTMVTSPLCSLICRGRGIHVTCSLRFISGATPIPILPANIAASHSLPCTCEQVLVGLKTGIYHAAAYSVRPGRLMLYQLSYADSTYFLEVLFYLCYFMGIKLISFPNKVESSMCEYWMSTSLPPAKFVKVMFSQVSVCPRGDLCPGGISVQGVSVQGGLCLEGTLSRGSLSSGVSAYRGLCQGEPPLWLHAGLTHSSIFL